MKLLKRIIVRSMDVFLWAMVVPVAVGVAAMLAADELYSWANSPQE